MLRLKNKRNKSDDKLNELEDFIEVLRAKDARPMEVLGGHTIPVLNDIYFAKMNTYHQILNKIKELKNE